MSMGMGMATGLGMGMGAHASTSSASSGSAHVYPAAVTGRSRSSPMMANPPLQHMTKGSYANPNQSIKVEPGEHDEDERASSAAVSEEDDDHDDEDEDEGDEDGGDSDYEENGHGHASSRKRKHAKSAYYPQQHQPDGSARPVKKKFKIRAGISGPHRRAELLQYED